MASHCPCVLATLERDCELKGLHEVHGIYVNDQIAAGYILRLCVAEQLSQ